MEVDAKEVDATLVEVTQTQMAVEPKNLSGSSFAEQLVPSRPSHRGDSGAPTGAAEQTSSRASSCGGDAVLTSSGSFGHQPRSRSATDPPTRRVRSKPQQCMLRLLDSK